MLKETKRKLTVQVWTISNQAVAKKLRAINVKRDAYLGELLVLELRRLKAEVQSKNPSGASKMIRKYLGTLPRDKVTLALDKDLANELDQVLADLDIPRDAFVNRVFFFLVAKPNHLKKLDIGFDSHTYSDITPLQDAAGFLFDPFFGIRKSNDEKFYTLPLTKQPIAKGWPSLFGLNCSLDQDEWHAINTPESNLAEMLDGVDGDTNE